MVLFGAHHESNKGCVTHNTNGLALPFTLKKVLLRQKEEELWKLKYISPCKNNIIFQRKILLKKKKPPNPSRYYYYNSIITNLKFQHKAKNYHLSKILI
jgi:hypothetical protein